jgi:NAD(P)H-dependent flavin oxidoreductase YrpB (nitropropane dioxygenase family)
MNSLIIGDLKVKVPIIQGGMGVAISLSQLASAVANQGGIGVISAAGIGFTQPDYQRNFQEANRRALRLEIQKARSLTKGVLGVNLMVALTDYDEFLKIAIDEKIDIVFLGAGLPLKMPDFIVQHGFSNIKTKFAVKVSSPKAAKVIFNYWSQKFNHIPDAIVVEGPLAGGHLGFTRQELADNEIPLEQLIRETVEMVKSFETQFGKKVPVIAAGGIYTGADMYHIMKAGAAAVKLGTRFVTTHECDADIAFKMSYVNSSKEDITIINSPVGLPGRVIRNEFVNQIERGEVKPFKCPWKCLKTCNFKEVSYCISQTLHNSARGMMNDGFAFAGANAYRATKIESVKDVFDDLISGYNQLNNKLKKKYRPLLVKAIPV